MPRRTLTSMQRDQHFDRVAQTYSSARPPYPPELYAALEQAGIAAPGRRIVEIGAGSGQATRELIDRGCEVLAVEPGPDLAARLRATCPEATVLNQRFEDAALDPASVDAAVAATSMHWVDLPHALPLLHAVVRPGGVLAVWRTVYGDPRIQTPFRDAVSQIVAARPAQVPVYDPLTPRPTIDELEAGSWFTHQASREWTWSVQLDPHQLRRLFETFPDWAPAELDALEAAALRAAPVIEHYVTILHILRRT